MADLETPLSTFHVSELTPSVREQPHPVRSANRVRCGAAGRFPRGGRSRNIEAHRSNRPLHGGQLWLDPRTSRTVSSSPDSVNGFRRKGRG
jgi:hypothetical protein